MALGLFNDMYFTREYSQNGTLTNPVEISLDGRTGGVYNIRLYLANNDEADTNTYTNVIVAPHPGNGRDVTAGEDGYSWKLSLGENLPSEDEWSGIAAGAAISCDDVTAPFTYQPFWLRVEVPAGAAVETFTSTTLRITATAVPT